MKDYTGEYGCSVASSRPEDLVPGLINLLRVLDKDELLSSGQQDELAWLDTAWENGCHDVGTLWTDMDTAALIDLAETALPAGYVLDISGQWADRCVYVDYDADNVEEGSSMFRLFIPSEFVDDAARIFDEDEVEYDFDSGDRFMVPDYDVENALDLLEIAGIPVEIVA